jgi:glycosyltransferase involved in cell wall biosynthesis
MDTSHDTLPRVLIVSDSSPGPLAFGSARTLGNLLVSYPPERYSIALFPSTRKETLRRCHTLALPFGEQLKRFLPWLYHSLVSTTLPVAPKLSEAPELILVTASRLDTYLYATRIARTLRIPIVPYFMDDLRSNDRTRWIFSSGHQFFRSLLSDAAGALFISDVLRDRLRTRYESMPERTLVIHNPIPLDMFPFTPACTKPESALSITYTGSVWGMHRDALELFVHAIDPFNDHRIRISLSIFAPPDQVPLEWGIRRGVTLHHPVEYERIPSTLSSSDLLLVCSAFDPAERYLVETSLQTKVTDYLAAGRPIVAVGPDVSASSLFVTQNRAGYLLSQPSSEAMRASLEYILSRHHEFGTIGLTNRKLAEDRYCRAVVIPKLYQFLKECSS